LQNLVALNLEIPGQVIINIFNILGEKVSEIVKEYSSKGKSKIIFDAKDLPS